MALLMHRLLRWSVREWILFLALMLPASQCRTAAQVGENDVKAAFLFNFAQFCEWPPEAFISTNAPIIIGILGEDPFGSVLDQIIRGETVQKRPIELRRYRSVSDIRECHILYIGRSEGNRLEMVLRRLGNRPVLTVSDIEGFATRGGMIRLYTEQKRVRLRINLAEVERGRLRISAKVLSLAEIVQGSRNE